MWNDFNINDNVRVRLTDHGRDVHRRQFDLMRQHIKETMRDEWQYAAPKEDADGWSTWQLWSLLNTFGPHVWIMGEMCFATQIQFETK